MYTWILAGQSNMQGYAMLDDPRRTVFGDRRVEQLTSAGEWALGEDPLHRLWESYTPVHQALMRPDLPAQDTDLDDAELARRARAVRRDGAGLGIAFATAYADATGEAVGLIPAAHGGTSLAEWKPGHSVQPDASPLTLYGAMLDRVRRARLRSDVQLRGVLWYQGESDANTVDAPSYAERFDHWLARLRRDLDEPDLPLYAVQLGPYSGSDQSDANTNSAWDLIREAQRTLPSRSRDTGIVSAVDLGLCDPIHIDAPSLERLGRRLARLAATASTGPDVDRVELAGSAANDLCLLRVTCRNVTGSWHPASRLPGFVLCDDHGAIMRGLRVVDAHPDPHDATAIRIVTDVTDPLLLDGARLAYGLGCDPVCSAVDDADMPLPAFAPQPIDVPISPVS